jgi:hypothetical protein
MKNVRSIGHGNFDASMAKGYGRASRTGVSLTPGRSTTGVDSSGARVLGEAESSMLHLEIIYISNLEQRILTKILKLTDSKVLNSRLTPRMHYPGGYNESKTTEVNKRDSAGSGE